MDRDEIIRRLMKTFLVELGEYIESLEKNLLALERADKNTNRLDTIQDLFRVAHSLKGSARSIDIDLLANAAHAMETIFDGLRRGDLEDGKELFQVLFRTVDAIREARDALEAGRMIEQTSLPRAIGELTSFSTPEAQQTAPDHKEQADAGRRNRQPHAGDKMAGDLANVLRKQPSAAPPAEEAATSGSSSIRVSVSRLDRLRTLSSELLVAHRRLDLELSELQAIVDDRGKPEPRVNPAPRNPPDHVAGLLEASDRKTALRKDLSVALTKLRSIGRYLEQTIIPLEAEVRECCMVPFSWACLGLDRIVRDLSRSLGKEATLKIEGGDTDIDRSLAEALRVPLIQLVRNALYHGIEPSDSRRTAAKSPVGTVAVSATLSSGTLQVLVADDGRGIDEEAIRLRASSHGTVPPASATELAALIFEPGFSTVSEVSEVSGRGVGLDIVKSSIKRLRGSIQVRSSQRKGTTFVIELPQDQSTLQSLIVASGDHYYAFDAETIEKVLRIERAEVKLVDAGNVFRLGDDLIPLFLLEDQLGHKGAESVRDDDQLHVILIQTEAERAGFIVDDVVATQSLSVRSLPGRWNSRIQIDGTSTLPTGETALIINSASLLKAARSAGTAKRLVQASDTAPEEVRPRLLVVDDSVTTRALVQSILETAGYEVLTASDGFEGWQVLKHRGADLVVSDIQMPRMDGFTFVETMRASREFRDTPVILVTAMSRDEDRSRGLEAGADAYLVKRSFDQSELIETINRLL